MTAVMALAVAMVVPAAIAWACNPQANISVPPSVGPGDSIKVSGAYFNDADTISVTINGGGSATAKPSGGGFTVSLTAPSQPGNYSVVASKADGGYRAGLPKTASFSVVGSQAGSPSGQSGGSTQTPAQAGAPSFKEPSVTRSPSRSVARGDRDSGSRGTERGAQGGETQSAPVTGGVGGGGGIVTAPSGEAVFAGSAAPAQAVAAAPAGSRAAARGERSERGASQASERAAASDVWSGFVPGRTSTLGSTEAAAPDSGAGSQLNFGIALLGIGLVGLFAGFAVAEALRRRRLAGQR